MAGLKREACSHDQPWSGGKTRIGKKLGRVQKEPSLESRFEKDVKKNFRAFPKFFAGMKVKSVLGGSG
jgi:hypothetical protein